jgi:transposase InsO family protein
LKSKDQALHYFKIYKVEVENQLERKIKHLKSDQGGKYFSTAFHLFCEEHGIVHERTRLIHSNPMGLPKERIAH